MKLSDTILSDVIIYSKYAKYIEEEKCREVWSEVTDRNKNMFIKKFPQLKEEIEEAYKLVYPKSILPSMRSLQFGGKAIEINPARSYNCSYTAIDSWEVFHEIMFLLLGGTGVGYSVQRHHVDQLPEIKTRPKRIKRFLLADSIEGWADAVKAIAQSYFFGLSVPQLDYSDIRPKGTPLKTSGGKAPGPQPLKDCIHHIDAIFTAREPGTKLTPLECHDIICHIADAVLAGGIRRAALISLFSLEDEEMMASKTGNWQDLNPQRGRANNSVVLLRHKINKKRFKELFELLKASGNGEPGLYFSNDKETGCNPCAEVSLCNHSFCNLTTVNVSDIKDQADFNARVKSAAFIGTLQATLTNFHYLRECWQQATEKESLLGVSLSGVASGNVLQLDIIEAAETVLEENARVAKILGIKQAARTTCVKPDGTSALVLSSSSGIHGWHSKYYTRRIRVLKTEPIYQYLKKKIPKLVEDDFFKPSTEGVLSIPVKAPEGATFRDEGAIHLLDRVRRLYVDWVRPGHRKGDNTHSVSVTVNVQDDEWDEVGRWMWENRQYYNGMTVIPYDMKAYKQAPHEEITKTQYDEMYKSLKEINLKEIEELEDNTVRQIAAACGSEGCEIR
jgi:ribonucleoside-triphosphate reductase